MDAITAGVADHGLRALTEPLLDPLFWKPEGIGISSDWWPHVPFAQWIVAAVRPTVFVELGTGAGVSYAAVCNAVQHAGLPTQCYGMAPCQPAEQFRQLHDDHFGLFSTLVHRSFDEAPGLVDDRSVDLLHIDGPPGFNAARQVYDTWLPKLSNQAVVLLHGINDRSNGAGPWRLWQALREQHPHFAFLHGGGLGLLVVGEHGPDAAIQLCSENDPHHVATIRARFAHLGARWLAETQERTSRQRIGALAEAATARDAAERALADAADAQTRQEVLLAQLRADAAQARLDATRQGLADQARVEETRLESTQVRADMLRLVEAAQAKLEAAHAQVEDLRTRYDQVRADTMRLSEAAQARSGVVHRLEVGRLRMEADTLAAKLTAASSEADQAKQEVERLTARLHAADSEAERARQEAYSLAARLQAAESEAAQARQALHLAQAEAKQAEDRAAQFIEAEAEQAKLWTARLLDSELRRARADADRALAAQTASGAQALDAARSELHHLRHDVSILAGQLATIQTSTLWRMTWPLRRFGKRLPRWARRGTSRAAQLAWWTMSFKVLAKRSEPRPTPTLHAGSPPQPLPLPQAPAVERAGSATRLLYISGEAETPGHKYRVERFIETALGLGMEAGAIPLAEIAARHAEIGAATVLVLWRTSWTPTLAEAVTTARRKGVRVVFDVDDLMIDPGFARTTFIDAIRSNALAEDHVAAMYANVRQAMLHADCCFTTTEELAFHMRGSGKTTYVLPNGFDQVLHDTARHARRFWMRTRRDALVRIGYAGGSRTHQRDFGCAVDAIAQVLREHDDCRLVLFRTPDGKTPLIDVGEFPALAGLDSQIEWRPLQPLADLPNELARFDINIAPLEYGNPFCEAKSELKFWEAALVEVPTIASPTGPYRRAIIHGKTGFLAASPDDWYGQLKALVSDPALRQAIARHAYRSSLMHFGPVQRALTFSRVIEQLKGGPAAANAFALGARLAAKPRPLPQVFPSDIVLEHRGLRAAEVTVIVPLYNYQDLVVEALDSVRDQTIELLDLVIVEGCSTDNSLAVAKAWAERNATRFNRLLLLRNRDNYGLGLCRNSGFDAADTPYVLPLDADNTLLPECCETLLGAIRKAGTAYVYPSIQQFGDATAVISNRPYDPQALVPSNYIDAMAIIDKEAWAVAGGYHHVRHGWEDYDLWCRFAEIGLRGQWHDGVLARYRVHRSSIINTLQTENYRRLWGDFTRRHPWVVLGEQHVARAVPPLSHHLTRAGGHTRLTALLPLLLCPETGEQLVLDPAGDALVSLGGLRRWPVSDGVPLFSPPGPACGTPPPLSDRALALIRSAAGPVLQLGAGGMGEKPAHVVEVDEAISAHTDVVAEGGTLPFHDECFNAVVMAGGLETARDPRRVIAELHRVLRHGGQILVQAAFLQPASEGREQYYTCTRDGFAAWMASFDLETLDVPAGLGANQATGRLVSDAEHALRRVSATAAEEFAAAPIGQLVQAWRDPARRDTAPWTSLGELAAPAQDQLAAGFEFVGRKPRHLPDLKAGGTWT